ncbi:NUDIX hydrolase [Metallococcus carri]|uniref:NUDIX hydrolase n=1 Tax=Metallococcus carri TaxID=1656884 RepID=UPI001A9FD838|nr:NUDIX hydrolase [Metallococcus carri]
MSIHRQIADLVRGLPADIHHHSAALDWLASTDDIWRREKPRTPDPHLVAYVVPVDRMTGRVLLADHRLSGLRLPPGGHVEPGEHPVDTVRRETVEELGVEARLDGDRPFFLTMTETVGDASTRHTDVSLWFSIALGENDPVTPDPREFDGVRWWSRAQLEAEPADRFDPWMREAVGRLGL